MARLFTPSESKYYLMALDAGTGSIRAVIFDLEGNQIAVGQAEWRHLAVPDVPGSMEFDLNKNWQLACECMRQALHNAGIDPEYIAAVSACSMREGIVLYNNEGTPIWACANVDARAAREVSELKELHNNTFENEVYRATGQTLALSAIPRLLWLAHHRSDIYRQASTITMISDWLAYMLSGESANGKHPLEAVQTMTRIAQENESALEPDLELNLRKVIKPVAAVLARSLVAATKELPVKAIVFDTYTGRVGRYLSTFRPEVPMYALCYSAHTMRELALVRGVEPIMITRTATKEEFVQKAIETLQQRGYVKQGDLIGYIGGDFGSQIGATYMEFKYVA